MKIAILTSTFFQQVEEIHGQDRIIFGGAERYLVELANFLRADGHEITVYQSMTGKEMITKEYQGIKIVCLPVQDTWELHVAPNLCETFHEMSIAADLRIYFASFLAWPRVKGPCISINHGVFWDFPGHYPRTTYGQARDEFFRRQIEGMTMVDACVAVDTNVRNFVAGYMPGYETRIHYVPNFVNTQQFCPRKDLNSGPIKILYPRRLTPVRGINEFMSAASELPECEFLLCGQSFSEEAEEMLVKYQEDTQHNMRTIYRPMEDMAEVYQAADIAVIPTRAAEGTSLSCLEAMATGLPIVTTPAGGLPNLVIDRWNGLLVDLNRDILTPALKWLIDRPEKMIEYGNRNREMAVEAFDIEVWKEKWRQVINYVM